MDAISGSTGNISIKLFSQNRIIPVFNFIIAIAVSKTNYWTNINIYDRVLIRLHHADVRLKYGGKTNA